MMSVRSLLLRFLLLLSVTCLTACTKEYPFLYRVAGIELQNVRYDNPSAIQYSQDTIVAANYAIGMKYTTEIYGTDDTYGYESDYLLGNKPVSFHIYSLNGFDSSHPALSPLDDYFYYNSTSIATSIKANLLFLPSGFERSNSRLKGDTSSSNALLRLITPPATLGYRQFIIRVVFTDSSILADTIGVWLR